MSGRLGILLFLAVLLHKLPEGVTIASVMVAGGQSRSRALGAAAVLGAAQERRDRLVRALVGEVRGS